MLIINGMNLLESTGLSLCFAGIFLWASITTLIIKDTNQEEEVVE